MATLVIPNSFSPNTTIQSSQVNANYSAVATWANTYAVQTDVAKTITVTHTWTASQTLSAGWTAAAACSISSGGLSVTGGLVIASGSMSFTTGTDTITWGTGTSGFKLRPAIGDALEVATADNSTYAAFRANHFFGVSDCSCGGVFSMSTPVSRFVPGVTSFSVRDNANANDNLLVSNAGAVTVRNGLTVSAGGATITGNVTVTGTVTAVLGSNTYVRNTTTVNFTASTDLTLGFAVGVTQEWEFEYVLAHTNASAATASFSVTGPTGATGYFGGFATVQGAGSAVQGSIQLALGNSLTGLTMASTAGFTHIRGYVKTDGTHSGTIAITGSVSAGTGVLQAGSYVRYCRIA